MVNEEGGAVFSVFNDLKLCDESIDKVISRVVGFSGPGFAYVVTPNIDHFSRLDVPPNDIFRIAYSNADLRICDSRIVKLLSIFESVRIKNVVPGSDLTEKILVSSWARSVKILIVGPERDDVDFIARKYLLNNVDSYTPPMGFIRSEIEDAKCVDEIVRSSADLELLAVGSPQQEILAYRAKVAGGGLEGRSGMLLCVGASLDFLSGKAARAPRLMQVLHLEWLHRACSNPRRLIPRYWSNFVWIVSYVYKRLIFKIFKG